MRRRPTDRFRLCLTMSVLMHGALLGILAVAMTSPRKTTVTMGVYLVGEETGLVRGTQHPAGKVPKPDFATLVVAAAAPESPRIAQEEPPARRDAAPEAGSKGTHAPPMPGHPLAAPASAGAIAATDAVATAGAAAAASPAAGPILPDGGKGTQAPAMSGHPLVVPAIHGENAVTNTVPTAFAAPTASPVGGAVLPVRSASRGGRDMVLGAAGAPRFIHRETPQYPVLAQKLGKEGRVVLRLALDDRGTLQNIEVVQSDGFGFAEAASTAIKQSTFAPAFRNGRRVSANIIVPVRFVLK